MFSPRTGSVLSAFLLLFVLTRLNYDVLPPTWPDEALFSSPAAALESRGVFATPVLAGLIPGMDRATLWNSPLYMLQLAGVYIVTGESLLAARGVSLFLAGLCLLVFARVGTLLVEDHRVRLALPVLLVCDLTFQRAANTARMDMLTLLLFVSCFYFLIKAAATAGRPGWRPAFFAGLCMGAAALAHPIAILLVPVTVIWLAPRVRPVLAAGLGALLVISAWLPYILRFPDVFCLQFLSQLERKQDILSLVGGDTGGVLVVFSSQYGGQKWTMLAALLVVALVLAAGALGAVYLRGGPFRRLYASLVVIFVLVLLASEAWYPLYVGVPLLWTAAVLFDRRAELGQSRVPLGGGGPWLARGPLLAVGVFFILTTAAFGVRSHLVYHSPEKTREFQTRMVAAVRDCRSVYLRVRPDPYFRLRRDLPAVEVLEFVPGKLRFGGDNPRFACTALPGGQRAYLERRFDSIDCFLLDEHESWEPILRDYLRARQSDFSVMPLPVLAPLEPAFLWRRPVNLAP